MGSREFLEECRGPGRRGAGGAGEVWAGGLEELGALGLGELRAQGAAAWGTGWTFIRLFVRSYKCMGGRKFSTVNYRISSPLGPLPKGGQ